MNETMVDNESGDERGRDGGPDWEDLNLFLAVAREGGLSAAARISGSSPATLGRRMHALERKLKRELFVRHDRGYRLTSEGQMLMTELIEVEAQIARLSRRAGTDRLPLVKVSAGTWTTLALLRNIATLAGSPSDIRLRFFSEERVLDIAHREVVIGLRNRRPTEASLAGRKLAAVEFAPYAAPGAPERWIRVFADTPSARWVAQIAGGDAIYEVTSPRNALDLALAGHGIALLPTFIGSNDRGLHQVGGVVAELTHDQWLVTHNDDRHLPEVRRVIERMCSILKCTKS